MSINIARLLRHIPAVRPRPTGRIPLLIHILSLLLAAGPHPRTLVLLRRLPALHRSLLPRHPVPDLQRGFHFRRNNFKPRLLLILQLLP